MPQNRDSHVGPVRLMAPAERWQCPPPNGPDGWQIGIHFMISITEPGKLTGTKQGRAPLRGAKGDNGAGDEFWLDPFAERRVTFH